MRPGASPFQKGMLGGAPWASSTRTIPADSIRLMRQDVRAEENDVAGHALDGEVLVQRADEGALGLGDHAVVRDLGDGAAALDGDAACAAPAAQNRR